LISFDRIRQAAAGQMGDDAKNIVTTGLDILDTLLRKNHDYGGSAWKTPVLAPGLTPREAIQCRMSDKIERLQKLLAGNNAMVQESIEDSMRDLAGYAVLWLGADR
jgi:hypothetical protein